MKVACDKCLKVEHVDKTKDWLRVSTEYSKFILCPDCEDGFWMAVDSELPPMVKKEESTNAK